MDRWLEWATEVQAISQTGLTYCKDKFCAERYERLREISAEIMSEYTDMEIEKVKDLFCSEKGYPTPKIDIRAVIFKDDKLLFVKEIDSGKWGLPGGWADINQTLSQNVERESFEEAGLNVKSKKILAVYDRNIRNNPKLVHTVYKVFVLCELVDGEFIDNIETTESRFFGFDELPEIDNSRMSKEEAKMCFDSLGKDFIEPVFD